MIRGLYTAATGMITKQVQMENLTNNIANINTAGFKKDNLAIKSFDEVLLENRDKYLNGKSFSNKLGKMEFGVGIDETVTTYSQGIIEETGRNLDFAINGSGFFTLEGADGEYRYTRDGRFKIDGNGFLTTINGERVVGINAAGIKKFIKVEKSDFKLGSDGLIENTGGLKFLISSFNNSQDLKKGPSNTYSSNSQPDIDTTSNIIQNSIEKSNVDPIEAVTSLITLMRNYESNQKILQQMDETLGKTVNEVGSLK
ncbi:flagellar basal body rod protein FlgG [Fervidicella metallireducens AeB]|uniref:Flagellar basal body rod protein FlgG n=1 Tax=Fervidicella metallireducens AeB TaxID=1403537 RepID=A0A017RVK4_9CLOT|nr:flagellar hook-basal body complex protein [Fervidicella metallireducens]EYE88813.1 flagellar basal body rod protein FlgG [Fervidicella metallireducens AeB]